jgi:hypothetical protein
MTGKADFTADEWHLIVEGPPTAGMIVLTAQRGGTFRETYSIAKSYAEARKRHGESALLDEIVSSKPELDHTRFHSPEELRAHGLEHLRAAVGLLESKAPDDLDAYRSFAVSLAGNVADAHRERGNDANASEAERAAIAEIAEALGSPAP